MKDTAGMDDRKVLFTYAKAQTKPDRAEGLKRRKKKSKTTIFNSMS
jgi:hypothetical protein